ncbi:MAG TPA: fibronectin type III domain-containing protein [Nitrosopumilaceae archaeon]|nr:fibronectin type III domain-containing protein [Nitrosopumilaceae archaeon]
MKKAYRYLIPIVIFVLLIPSFASLYSVNAQLLPVAPSPPTNLVANAVSSSEIDLSWAAPSNLGGLILSGYQIERSANGGISWSTIVPNTGSTATTYSDTGLNPSTSYMYRVSAINAVGTSSPSNTASATTKAPPATAPQPPTSLTATGISSSQINLSWTAPSNNGGSAITGYKIERSTDSGTTWSTVQSNTANTATTYSDTGLAATTTYTYRVSAINSVGTSSPSNTASATTGTTSTAPQPPTGLTATAASSSQINLSWTAPANNGGSAITGYKIERSTDSGTTWSTVIANTGSTATTYSDNGLAASTTYTYRVSAINSVGASPPSNTASATTSSATISGSSISLNTNSVNVGTSVRITGAKFAPNSPITISYDSYTYAFNSASDAPTPSNIQTDSNGGFVGIISVQHSVAGTHTIIVQDAAKNTATASVTMTPHVFTYPTSGAAGSQVLIPDSNGNGFAASSPITISFDGATVATSSTITTDTTGNFGGTFTIPSAASLGTHQIQVSDGMGNVYPISFTVVSSSTPTFNIQPIATGLSIPDRMAFIPDNGPGVDGTGTFMVLEKNTGNVIVYKNTGSQFAKQATPFVTIPNLLTGFEDNGLLGIAFDPNWTNSKLVYFYVTRTVSGSPVNEVIRYHATTDSSGNIVADSSVGEQLILSSPGWQDGHNGGCLKFDSAGNLYITDSDGWTFKGQDLTILQAKMLRITPLASPDASGKLYSIPSTNPFASSTDTSIKKEIWGYGVRNPYTFDIDSKSGRIYASDVGYNAWESIKDFTTAGANAGWSNYESPPFGNPQNLASYTPPVYWYPHEGVESQTAPEGLQAITGAAFYHGTYYPNLEGAYFFADYGVHMISALLPSSTAPPTIDPASGVPKGQVVPIYFDKSTLPIDLEVWNGALYFVDLSGSINVLNYGSSQPPSGGGSGSTLSPTSLTATAVSSSQINLSLTAPNNIGGLVAGYKIERVTGSNTNWVTIVPSTGSTATTYSDTGLSQSTIYTYRVSALYVGGVTSDPSNTASATTQCAICKLTVTTKLTTGVSLDGMYSELRNSTGGLVSSGFTPIVFDLKTGEQYTVGMGDYNTFVFDHWSDTGSSVNPRSVSITNNTQITAVYRDTAPLVLSPSQGPAGTTVTVTGTAFSPNQTITISYDGGTIATNPATITSNPTGGFTATFQVPLGSIGKHTVLATDGINTHSATFMDTQGP